VNENFTRGILSVAVKRIGRCRTLPTALPLLLHTHLLLWAASEPKRLPKAARLLLEDVSNDLLFTAASMWEITIKRNLGRDDFRVDPRLLRRGLLDNGYTELPITGEHASLIGDN
jgi:PIN domain nuclease of toxin-antitoxin system